MSTLNRLRERYVELKRDYTVVSEQIRTLAESHSGFLQQQQNIMREIKRVEDEILLAVQNERW